MGAEKKSCKTAAVLGLLNRGPAVARDTCVQPAGARDIETVTAEILEAKRAGGEAILTIGRGLIEAKGLLSHGEWLPWLEERVEFSEKAAQNFMRIARHYSNPQALADLGATKALMLLAIPEDSMEAFIAVPHLVNGEEKTVVDMTTRELKAAIRERDAARMAAERARAERAAAEQAREKISQDMALANERIAGLNDLVERYSAEAREGQEALAQAAAELKELRERPVEVAVEADAAAIDAARKEAEAAMRARVDEALAARRKAETALRAAREQAAEQEAALNSALNRAKMDRAAAVLELGALRTRAEQAEKKAELAGNADLVLFRALLELADETVNKLDGVMMKLRGKTPDAAAELSGSLVELADKLRRAAWRTA